VAGTERQRRGFCKFNPDPRNSGSAKIGTGFRPDISINDVSATEGNSGTKTVDFTVSSRR
jgi:hypothetical protein